MDSLDIGYWAYVLSTFFWRAVQTGVILDGDAEKLGLGFVEQVCARSGFVVLSGFVLLLHNVIFVIGF